jgi:cell division septum initiation protein DivIVA
MKDEYIEVSLEDYNNKTRLIKKQEEEISSLKKEIAGFEKALNQIYI